MQVIITDEDKLFNDEWQSGSLKEQGAWWTPKGVIFVYSPEYDTEEKQLGAIVHEGFEYLLICKRRIHNRWVCNFIHYVANILEIIVSVGKSPVLTSLEYWQWQNWR